MLARRGTNGTTSLFNNSAKLLRTSGLTPDAPIQREFKRITMEARVQVSGIDVEATGSSSGIAAECSKFDKLRLL